MIRLDNYQQHKINRYEKTIEKFLVAFHWILDNVTISSNTNLRTVRISMELDHRETK
jgi:hypothetical protein